jgi:hypothetical protein
VRGALNVHHEHVEPSDGVVRRSRNCGTRHCCEKRLCRLPL